MLQRIYRRNRVPKMIRQRLKEHRSSTNIGRNYRGYKGRLYYQEFFRICTAASIQIQSVYRMMVGRRRFNQIKKERTDAALAIQPIVRGWFGRQFVAWKRANDNLGTTMNNLLSWMRGASTYCAACYSPYMIRSDEEGGGTGMSSHEAVARASSRVS